MIYVGGGDNRCIRLRRGPQRIVGSSSSGGSNTEEAEVDWENVIFGDNSGNSVASVMEGEREAWQGKIETEEPIFLDTAMDPDGGERPGSPTPRKTKNQ